MYEGERILAVIGARGGSKGLRRKNTRLCAGKPLLAWTVEAGLGCPYVDKVVVSTEDPEIREVAIAAGAEVPFVRPAKLATDSAAIEDVIDHVLDELARAAQTFDLVLLLQPTSPLRTSAHVTKAIEEYVARRQGPHETMVSVHAAPAKVQWLMRSDERGLLEFCFDARAGGNQRQHAHTYFLPNGALYLRPVGAAVEGFYSAHTHAFVMDEDASVDVDYLEDFERAETLLLAASER